MQLENIPTWIWAAAAAITILLVRPRRPTHKDPTRLFPPTMRVEIARRAGGRCEHRTGGIFRCPTPGAEADHIYPHTKGGSTSLKNAQWLCRTHNRRKGAKTPSAYQIATLVRARRHYFPQGTDPTVRP